MKKIKSKALVLLCLLASYIAKAQGNIEMADVMRQNGKIYVVVAVLCIIFIGIAFYLIIIDRKVAKLEKELKQK